MRYFLIFYTGKTPTGRRYGTATKSNETFPNRDKVVADLSFLTGWNGIAITNIVEVSEQDYDSYIQ